MTQVDTVIKEAELHIEDMPMLVTSSGTKQALVPVDDDVNKEVAELRKAFEDRDTNGVILFASSKQRASTAAAETLLEGVRNKDLGGVGSGLNQIALEIKGFDLSMLRGDSKPGFFSKLFNKMTPIALWIQSYEGVETQINAVVSKLSADQIQLMEDIEKLDRLYDAQQDHFRGLESSISAGKQFLHELENVVLPKMKAEADASKDAMAGATYTDAVDMKDKIERRVHDLLLTRSIILQNLPAIRMTQQSDSGLVEKIETVKANTIPLWKQQMALLVAANRTKEAAEGVNAVADVTNELLKSGSDLVKDANVEARKALERGVVSIETIEYANNQLISMIEETQAIYNEAKEVRKDSEQRMVVAEQALKQAQLTVH